MEEQLRRSAGVEDAGTEEGGKGCKEDTRIVLDNDKIKGTSHVHGEMGNSCTTMNRHCSPCGKAGIGMTTEAGGWTRSCAPRHDVRRWSAFHRHKMYTRVPRETCLCETGKAPIKTGWAETDKGQPGKPNVRARSVAKE